MAITISSPGVETQGFLKCVSSADANAGETVLAGTANKKIKISSVYLSNRTAGALTFQVDGAIVLIGPVEIAANSTVHFEFNPKMALATNQALTVTVDAGAMSGIFQGVIE